MATPEIYTLASVGERVIARTEFLSRTDDACLIYPGLVHSFSGEPEALKSWVVLLAVLQSIKQGQHVLYLDYEDTAQNIAARLVAMGARPPHLERVHYSQPEGATDAEVMATYRQLIQSYSIVLVVIDGVTESMTGEGLDLMSNKDIATWLSRLPRPLTSTGAAVVLVDHLTKNRDNQSRWQIGGQHKLAGISVSYKVEAEQELAPAVASPVTGISRIVVTKDRPGQVRSISLDRKYPGKFYATANLDGTIHARIIPETETRPLDVMRAVSELLMNEGEPMSLRSIRKSLRGRNERKDLAVKLLAAEGFIGASDGGFFHITPFNDNPPVHSSFFRFDDEEDD